MPSRSSWSFVEARARPRIGARLSALVGLAVSLVPGAATAEEPLSQRYSFAGNADFFATGAAMAADGPDGDTTNVDLLLHPAITTISADDIPADANLRKAFLYWGGSIANDDCAGTTIDEVVTFTAPGQAPVAVVAGACYCSEAGAQSYDIQLCKADVTAFIGGLVGEYAVDDFLALIANGTTHNASFSIVLVYSANSLPARSIAIYDGLLTMWNQSNADELIMLDQIVIDDPPAGDLTWYALEGDIGGGGAESVSVVGTPGNLSMDLFDGFNPVDNPMNHTINTTMPAQTEALGVDIDEFDISAALTAGDTAVATTYSGGGDKYWIAYNVVGVNIYAPEFSSGSTKTWALELDADQTGDPSPGDTIRYTIDVANMGDVPGVVELEDLMPAQVDSWALVDAGGGVDLSTPDTLIIGGLAVANGDSTQVVFDVVIAAGTAGSNMINVANYAAPPDGGEGPLEAAPVPIGATPGDGDGDGDPGDGDGDGDGDGNGTGGGGSGDDGGATGSDGDESAGSSGPGPWPGATLADAGCGCTSSRSPAPSAVGLFLLVWLRRRNR